MTSPESMAQTAEQPQGGGRHYMGSRTPQAAKGRDFPADNTVQNVARKDNCRRWARFQWVATPRRSRYRTCL